MASLSRYGKNKDLFRILFRDADGVRRTLYLGDVSEKSARSILARVDDLVNAQAGYPLDGDTARWVADLKDEITEKLAGVGLIPKRACSTLKPFLDGYIAGRTDVKPGTKLHLERVRDDLVAYLGAATPIRDITRGDADGFRLHLLHKGLAENTTRRRCGRAKQFFNAAVRRGLIAVNPFADVKSAIQANPGRFRFIDRATIDKVLAACPDDEWRLMVALSRYGGLRCPSEHLSLKWIDVDWDSARIRVRSPKTEHHPGGESRLIPIFPELRPYLESLWFDESRPPSEYVITRYRDRNANLRTQFNRILQRAGIEPWGRLFQNLRSTRETELAETFPIHVVCKWIGNSEAVAKKHYLQVTDEHFDRANSEETSPPPVRKSQRAPCPQVAANGITAEAEVPKTPGNTLLDGCSAPRQGLEPWT